MDSTENILFRLMRAALTGTQPEMKTTSPEMWKKLFELSARQGILAMIYDAIQRLPTSIQPPKEILLRWAVNTDRIERHYIHLTDTLEQLAAFYAKHHLPMMILKGPGLASLYPIPAHRPCGDLDIWLYGRQPEADELIRCELGIAVSDEVHHHTVFTFNGTMIENHFDFLNQWSHRSNREIERELRLRANTPGQMLQVGSQTVGLPSPDLNALFLMRHMAAHFAAAEIGLRHLADWAVFLRSEGDKVDWTTIYAIFRDQNMHRFADAVTALCVKQLGVDPTKAYSYESDSRLQQLILFEVINPTFGGQPPKGNPLNTLSFKFCRWWSNRWKHKLVYKDSLVGSFLWLCWGHIIRPKTIIH